MTTHSNEYGQPVGFPVPGWEARPRPTETPMAGRYCHLERLDAARHAAQLFAAHSLAEDGRPWTYLPYGPFADLASFESWAADAATTQDPLFFAIVDGERGDATGVASYLRIDERMGSIEVGHLAYSPSLQRTPAATEAMYLMIARAFDELGYRRYEWKCDSFNEPSRQAALRLGFQYEGEFRQATVYKGRNRNHHWFSITDADWPALKAGFEAWLDPSNFDEQGRQRTRLHGRG